MAAVSLGYYVVAEESKPSTAQKSKEVLLQKRRAEREAANEKRKAVADQLKEEGNAYFRKGQYVEAIAKYNEAAKAFGLKPVIMCNLAAAYLKLEQYELAEWAADCALVQSPRMVKARFRRAMARKALGLFGAAELDLQVVVQHHPDMQEAPNELKEVQALKKKWGEGVRDDLLFHDEETLSHDEEFPPFNNDEYEFPLESDSEDSKRTGNGKPCRFYNHGGCGRTGSCEYSHASDEKSLRDELGQNVCLYFLLGCCKYKNKCVYAHTKEYLPQGWWNDPRQTQEARNLRAALDDPITDFHTIGSLKNSTAYGLSRKGQEYLQDFVQYSSISADVLRSRLKKNKQTASSDKSSPSGSDRFVLLLSLEDHEMFNNINAHFTSALRAEVNVVQAKTISQVSTYLSASELAGVFVTDGGIVRPSSSAVVRQLVEYVKRGGLVVFGGLFPSFVSGTQMDRFFKDHFGLPWKSGEYFRTTFHKNMECDLVKRNPSLVEAYSMKALHLKGIKTEGVIYRANSSSRHQSFVFSPTPVTNLDETPAVSAQVGNGTVSYLGDVNAEEESTKTILAMLGLLDDRAPLPARKEPEVAPPTEHKKASKKKSKKKSKKNKTNPPDPAPETRAQSMPGSHSTPGIAPNNRDRFIMQLSLTENEQTFLRIHQHQIDAVEVKKKVKRATTQFQALSLLSSPYLDGVYATDEALTSPEYHQVLQRLVLYVKSGGYLVFGGLFSNLAQYPDVAPLFSAFGCQWRAGDYTSNPLELNRGENETADVNTFLPKNIHIKALYLEGIDPEDAVYRPSYGASTSSRQSPIVHTRIGNGFLGYIGDVNGENCTTPSLLAMLNLLKYPRSLTKPLPHKFVIAFALPYAFDEFMASTLSRQLQAKGVEVLSDKDLSDPRIVDLLTSPDLLGILVLGDIFYDLDRQWLAHQIASYVWSGGTVIFGGDLVYMAPDEFEELFAELYLLPWKISSATELPVKLNKNHALVKRMPASAQEENVYFEGCFLFDVSSSAMVYCSEANLGPERARHVPVAHAQVGKGHVGYFGCDKFEEINKDLAFAMLGL